MNSPAIGMVLTLKFVLGRICMVLRMPPFPVAKQEGGVFMTSS